MREEGKGKKQAKGKAKATAELPRYPFDRLPDETTPAWRAFLAYRALGIGRTMDAVRTQLGRAEAYDRTLERWRLTYAWDSRAAAWDAAEKKRLEDLADPLDAEIGLTLKQKRFSDAYLANGGNGVRAAMNAEYAGDYNTLAVTAHDNLKNPKIRRYIDQRMRESAMSADEVLHGLSQIARGDMREFIGRSAKELKAHPNGYLIKKIEIKTETEYPENGGKFEVETIKLELYSRADALQMLGRYHKLFTDKVEVEDWRSKAINLIKSGAVTYEDVVEVYGDESLAVALFRQAGVAVHQTSSTD